MVSFLGDIRSFPGLHSQQCCCKEVLEFSAQVVRHFYNWTVAGVVNVNLTCMGLIKVVCYIHLEIGCDGNCIGSVGSNIYESWFFCDSFCVSYPISERFTSKAYRAFMLLLCVIYVICLTGMFHYSTLLESRKRWNFIHHLRWKCQGLSPCLKIKFRHWKPLHPLKLT